MEIKVIPNRKSEIKTTVTIKTPLFGICPHSGEPQKGSFISVSYAPKENLIELHAIEEYISELSKGSDPLDLETVVQMIAEDCRKVAEGAVVEGVYKLKNELELICKSQI